MNASNKGESIQSKAIEIRTHPVKIVYLVTTGLNCSNCASRVRHSLLAISGIIDVKIDFFDGMTEVTYNPNLLQPSSLPELISAAGDGSHHKYGATIIG